MISSLQYCVLLAVVAIGVVSAATGDTPSFPSVDLYKSYSTYYSISDGTTGWTYASKEYFNLALNKTRLESAQTMILDLTAQTTTIWDPYTVSNNATNTTQCTTFAILNTYMLPTYYRWASEYYGDNKPVYNQTLTIDKGINCNQFLISSVIPGQNVTNSYVSSLNYTNINTTYVTSLNASCDFTAFVDADSQLIPNGTVINANCTLLSNLTTSCIFANSTGTENVTSVTCYFQPTSIDILDQMMIQNISVRESLNSTEIITTANITYSKEIYINAATNIPVREIFNASSINQSLQIDWVYWINSNDQQPALYQVPPGMICDVSTNTSSMYQDFNIPTTKVLGNASFDVNLLSPKFSVVLDERLEGTSSTSTIVWRMDLSNAFQSVDVDQPVGGDTITVINNNQNGTSFTFNTFNLECVTYPSSTNLSPYTSDYRKNAIYHVLVEKPSNWTYVQRTVRRMIDVDAYFTTYNNSYITFNVTLYVAAPGWQFPARHGVDNTTQVPIYIESVVTDTSKNITYHDAWDIYMYIPQTFPTNYQTMDAIGCLPTIPGNYSASVQMTFGDVGATLNYQEYNIQNQSYSAVNKFGNPGDRGVIDYVNNKYYLISAFNSNCSVYSIGNQTLLNNIGPSVNYLKRNDDLMGSTVYLGIQTVRGIKSRVWTTAALNVSYTEPNNTDVVYRSNIQYTFYWGITPQGLIPVRVLVQSQYWNASNATDIKSFDIVVDWTIFTVGVPPANVFATDTAGTCNNVDQGTLPSQFSTNLLPNRKFVVPSVQPQPYVPNQFSSQLLVTLNSNNGAVSGSYNVEWQYSTTHKAEQVKITNNQDQSTVNYVFCYKTAMGGEAYVSKNGDKPSTVSQNGVNKLNVLRNVGDPSLPERFISNGQTSPTMTLGQSVTYSGVVTENWVSSSTSTSSSVLWYPGNWIFSPTPSNVTRVPLVIVNNQVSNSTVLTTSQWDVQSISSGTLNDFAICKSLHIRGGFENTGLSVGALVAIVLVCTIVAVVIAALTVVFLRRRGVFRRRHAPHIRLDERNGGVNPNRIMEDDNEELIKQEF